MNYLRIENKGLIEVEDLMLIGSSTKRDQFGKIGMFGSGWKYALAWLLRNECAPKIFSGVKEISIDFNVKLHRNNPVNVITVNGIETSLTTEMGMNWKGWMAIREIVSNAIDEGEYKLDVVFNPSFDTSSDKTIVFIPMNNELANITMSFDKYFAFNRKESFSFSNARYFTKDEASEMNVYRKGIRCYDGFRKSKLDVDFNNIKISEERLSTFWDISREVQKSIKEINTGATLLMFLQNFESDFFPDELNENNLNALKELIANGKTFTCDSLRALGGLLISAADSIVIPNDWYSSLIKLKLIKSPLERFDEFNFVRTDSKNTEGVKYYLKGLGISIDVISGKLDQRSGAKYHNGVGYVSDEEVDDRILAAALIKQMDTNTLACYLK